MEIYGNNGEYSTASSPPLKKPKITVFDQCNQLQQHNSYIMKAPPPIRSNYDSIKSMNCCPTLGWQNSNNCGGDSRYYNINSDYNYGYNDMNTGNYVYQEPEENFVSIDDAKVKGFLMKIGQESKNVQHVIATEGKNPVVYEIVELDDDNETNVNVNTSNKTLNNAVNIKTKPSPPITTTITTNKNQTNGKERIVAQIDLIDSNSDNSDEEEQMVSNKKSSQTNYFQYPKDNQRDNKNDIKLMNRCDDDIFDNDDDELLIPCESITKQKERSLFQCGICNRTVQSSYNLRRHMMIHTGERPFGCDICERRFREFSDLKKHRRRHANETNYMCMVCRVNKPTENDSTHCHKCDAKSSMRIAAKLVEAKTKAEGTNTTNFKYDINEQTKLPIKRTSTNISPMLNVTSSTPISAKISKSPTSEIDKIINSIQPIQRTQPNKFGVTMQKEFACPICERTFGTRHNLKRHYMIHTGEKPFSCEECRKPFREFSTLKKHMITHQRERWYKCSRCPQRFKDYMKYVQHKRQHPYDTDSNNEDDTLLDNELLFTQNDNEQKYINMDYDDSNDDDDSMSIEDCLECCECFQRFTDIDSYNEHLKEHDPTSNVFECFICKKKFEEHRQLVQHMCVHN